MRTSKNRTKIENILSQVRKPSRYTGGEWNQTIKGEKSADIALAYPDVYEVGMSNLGLRLLYEIVNDDDRFSAARVFLPWTDMIEKMESAGLPLYSLETKRPVADFDVLGISLQTELTYTNVLRLLDMAGISRRAGDRSEEMPIVIGGGPGAFNPEPLSPFFDLFVIGEAEKAVIEIMEAVSAFKDSASDRKELIKKLSDIDGVYAPMMSDYSAGYPLRDGKGAVLRIKKRAVKRLETSPALMKPVVPFLETIHDRCVVEIMRGCSRGCRFCQAGMVYRPVRERSAKTIASLAAAQAKKTGYDDISLASLSSTDHSQLEAVLSAVEDLPAELCRSVSLPSTRTDRFSVGVAETLAGKKRTGLTFAPEAGTQKMRDAINKGLSEEEILDAAKTAFSRGWMRIKFYFMIGLPGETEDDVLGIADLVDKVLDAAVDAVGARGAGRVRITVNVSTFVPKPHTPFQWRGIIPVETIEHRQKLLKTNLPRRAELKWHEAGASLIEAVLARGGRRLADVIETAYEMGALFDGWSDLFSLATWDDAFKANGIDLAGEATADWDISRPLPWSHIDSGVGLKWLWNEYERSTTGTATPDCRKGECSSCGACTGGLENDFAAG